MRIARKHLGWYAKDLAGGDAFRREVNAAETSAAQIAAVHRFFDRLAGRGERLDYVVAVSRTSSMRAPRSARQRPESLRGGEALAA